MTENGARFALMIATGVGLLAVVVSLLMGFAGNNTWAAIFLVVTFACLFAALFFRRRYTRLRAVRWQDELESRQWELDNLFREAGANDGAADAAKQERSES